MSRQVVDPEHFRQLLADLMGAEKEAYLDAVATPPASVFRFNPLKHSPQLQQQILTRQGFGWEPVPGPAAAHQLTDRPAPLGQSLAHVLGHIYVQDRSSMLPVEVLGARPGERILDMCASPGSKTTQLAAAMENTGLLLANDVSTRRLKVLISNLRRFGVRNTGVRRGFGEQCGNHYFEVFDRVLLDPPCSALGTVGKSPEVLGWWSPERTLSLATVQKNLMHSALKALRPGGVLTYSTCTVTPEENEEVVLSALQRCPVELEAIACPGVRSRPGLTSWRGKRYGRELEKTIRLYPFDNGGEGFFIARLRKLGSFGEARGRRQSSGWSLMAAEAPAAAHALDSLNEAFQIEKDWKEEAFRQSRQLWVSTGDWLRVGVDDTIQTIGLPLAHCYRDQVRLTTEGAHWLSGRFGSGTVELESWQELQDYVDRVDIARPSDGATQVIAQFQGHAIGHALLADGALRSRFPRTGYEFAVGMSPASHQADPPSV